MRTKPFPKSKILEKSNFCPFARREKADSYDSAYKWNRNMYTVFCWITKAWIIMHIWYFPVPFDILFTQGLFFMIKKTTEHCSSLSQWLEDNKKALFLNCPSTSCVAYRKTIPLPPSPARMVIGPHGCPHGVLTNKPIGFAVPGGIGLHRAYCTG
jgi:hypothetical protein